MTVTSVLDLAPVRSAWRPPERVPAAEWCPANIRFPKNVSAIRGVWAASLYPYLAGPLEAFDSPYVQTIALRWATRLGKTTVPLALGVWAIANDPAPILLAGPTEPKTLQIAERFLDLVEATPATRGLVPPPGKRNWKKGVSVGSAIVHVGWSRSAASLGDLPIKYLVCFEASKWVNPPGEGDSIGLALSRIKGYPGSKAIFESTPTVEHHCRVSARMDLAERYEYFIPCPRCDGYQILQFEGEDCGVRWEKLGEHSTPEIARRTAHYVCRHCAARIEPAERPAILRAGVWRREGSEPSTDPRSPTPIGPGTWGFSFRRSARRS